MAKAAGDAAAEKCVGSSVKVPHYLYVAVTLPYSIAVCLQAALATALGMAADTVTDTAVNQYITEGANAALGSSISSCVGSATSRENRTFCTSTAAESLLVGYCQIL